MKRSLKTIATAASVVLLAASPEAFAYAESPTETLRKTHEKINELLSKRDQAKEKSAQYRAVERELTDAVTSFLDFEELARLALGKHWGERTEREQREFVDLLRRLIERSYINQAHSNLKYRLTYKGEHVEAQQATVTTAVRIEKNGRPQHIEIVYKMRRVDSGWMVYDVITDEVSILRNYRSQFNRIIQRDSYEVLVSRMRSRLDQFESRG